MGRSQLLPCTLISLTFVFLLSCGHASIETPVAMGRSEQDLNNPLLAVSGVYADGWIGPSGSMTLAQPAGGAVLRVRAMVPLTSDPQFRTALEVRLNEEPIARRSLGLGSFDLSFPVPPTAGKRRITLAFDRTQALPGGDGRQVAARLESTGFEKPDASRGSAPGEIVDDSHVRLLKGWGKLETSGAETFRLAENDAQLALDVGSAHDAVVTLLLEPGPGAGAKPMLVRVLDESDHQAGAIFLDRRGTYRLPLPLKGGKAEVFKLHVDGAAMSFRAFAIEAEAWTR